MNDDYTNMNGYRVACFHFKQRAVLPGQETLLTTNQSPTPVKSQRLATYNCTSKNFLLCRRIFWQRQWCIMEIAWEIPRLCEDPWRCHALQVGQAEGGGTAAKSFWIDKRKEIWDVDCHSKKFSIQVSCNTDPTDSSLSWVTDHPYYMNTLWTLKQHHYREFLLQIHSRGIRIRSSEAEKRH